MKKHIKLPALDYDVWETVWDYVQDTEASEVIDIFISHILYAFVMGTHGYHIAIEESDPSPDKDEVDTYIIGKKQDLKQWVGDSVFTFPIDTTIDADLYELLSSMRDSMIKAILTSMEQELEYYVSSTKRSSINLGLAPFSDQDIINICAYSVFDVVVWASECRGNDHDPWCAPWLNQILKRVSFDPYKKVEFPRLSRNRKMEYSDQLRKKLQLAISQKNAAAYEDGIDGFMLGYPEDENYIDEITLDYPEHQEDIKSYESKTSPDGGEGSLVELITKKEFSLKDDNNILEGGARKRKRKLKEDKIQEEKKNPEDPIKASFDGSLFSCDTIEETEI